MKKKGAKGQLPKGKPFPGEKANASYGALPGKGQQMPKGKGGEEALTMRASERSRLHFVEAQAKRYKWRSVALVGVNDTALARQFLAHFPRCKVLVVPIWREDLRPGPAGAQRNFQRNLRLWTKAYGGRFECEQGPPLKVAELTERQFDGVVLWTGIAPELLAVIGGAWVPRVVDGGWLLGVDHRLALVRSVLNQVAPGWVQYREGIWGVRVRRNGEAGDSLPVVDDLDAAAGADDDLSDASAEAEPAEELLIGDGSSAHDTADSGHVAEGEPGDGPIKPPVGETVARRPRMARIMGESVYLTAEEVAAIDKNDTPPKRRGGRPKGSKNKPKDAAA